MKDKESGRKLTLRSTSKKLDIDTITKSYLSLHTKSGSGGTNTKENLGSLNTENDRSGSVLDSEITRKIALLRLASSTNANKSLKTEDNNGEQSQPSQPLDTIDNVKVDSDEKRLEPNVPSKDDNLKGKFAGSDQHDSHSGTKQEESVPDLSLTKKPEHTFAGSLRINRTIEIDQTQRSFQYNRNYNNGGHYSSKSVGNSRDGRSSNQGEYHGNRVDSNRDKHGYGNRTNDGGLNPNRSSHSNRVNSDNTEYVRRRNIDSDQNNRRSVSGNYFGNKDHNSTQHYGNFRSSNPDNRNRNLGENRPFPQGGDRRQQYSGQPKSYSDGSERSRAGEFRSQQPIGSSQSVQANQQRNEVRGSATARKTYQQKDKGYSDSNNKIQKKKSSIGTKLQFQDKVNQASIYKMLDQQDVGRTRSVASIVRSREKQKRKLHTSDTVKVYREVSIYGNVTVVELASLMSEKVTDVIKELMRLGVVANANYVLDRDLSELIITTFGHTPKYIQENTLESLIAQHNDRNDIMRTRPPVVTIMGHVDHGKTSLLDAIRNTDVAGGEHGGITQKIGAYSVGVRDNNIITFIDTPGHEAFTAMRSRGARITDIVVIVVAADDGIMIQTIEAINHARAANVAIVVAVNKIDKPGANINKISQELLSHKIVLEEFGGDVIAVPVSALNGTNIDKLLDTILLVAEMLDIKANYDCPASGTVVESRIDKGRGIVATVLVQRGTLKIGDIVVAGSSYGRIRLAFDCNGIKVNEVTPSVAVEILGLESAPIPGSNFVVVETEKEARVLSEANAAKERSSRMRNIGSKVTQETMFSLSLGKIKILKLIIKADTQGSIEAITGSIAKIEHDEIKVEILHAGVGAINESDITLASASGSKVIGFNTRVNAAAGLVANNLGIEVRYYAIIYHLIDDIREIMTGMLSLLTREEYLGSASIRQVFNITKSGNVAGVYVTDGVVKRGASARLIRDGVVIHDGKLKTLKRFKDDVKEVRDGYECGLAFENYEDIKVGDTIEIYEIVSEKQKIVI